jgi:prepilin-type N-terminal cleavage/methylation domain-containing protein
MASVRARGFTLIELLTVVAIIAILAALTAVAVPRVLQQARLTSAENAMNQMGTIIAAYFAEQGSYPPGYGYIRFDRSSYWLTPWDAVLGIYSGDDHIDPYSDSHDTNMNGTLNRLEFLPLGTQLGPNNFAFPNVVYDPGNVSGVIQDEVARQLQESRPFVYIPVNLNDFRKVSAYYNNASAGDFVARQRAATWDASSPALQSVMGSAPAKYDAFVLISVGPNLTTAGVLPDYLPATGPNEYYMTGLRAYFLATRDANNNGSLDFDYRSRTGGGQDSSADAYRSGGIAAFADQLILMPDGTGAPGPLIFSRQ